MIKTLEPQRLVGASCRASHIRSDRLLTVDGQLANNGQRALRAFG
jgi:hypothetical protein